MRDTERNLISSFKRRETAQFVHLARRDTRRVCVVLQCH
jgi:hypothetical protein